MNDNAAVLVVDISNLYACIGNKYQNRKLDYAKLYERASTFGYLRRAIAYGSAIADEAVAFITCLRRLGYETKYKKPKADDKKIRADWNVGMALDVVKAVSSHRLDAVLIATTNSDIIPLISWVREQGIRCIIVGCNLTKDLKDVADGHIEITEELLEETKMEEVS